jgi:hypothetical protein
MADAPRVGFRWLKISGLTICLIPCVLAIGIGLYRAMPLVRQFVAGTWTAWLGLQALFAGVAITMGLGGLGGAVAVLVMTRGLRQRPRRGNEQMAVSLALSFGTICAASCALELTLCLLVLLAENY